MSITVNVPEHAVHLWKKACRKFNLPVEKVMAFAAQGYLATTNPGPVTQEALRPRRKLSHD